MPHAPLSVPARQSVRPLQHPPQPENSSQRHWPLKQRKPGPQGRLLPHRQMPLTHWSAVLKSHDSHASPHVSKLVNFDWHTVPEQHPPSHDAVVHTHWPEPLHCVPGPHDGPVPQPQPPSVRHVLLVAPHAVHVPPAGPHAPTVGGETHAPAWQQPVGHDVASHTHVPPLQRWPTAHGGLLPQRQAPLVHRLERASQAVHAAPLVPHWAVLVAVTQVVPLQQPVVHVVEQPAHEPLTQVSPPHEVQAEPPWPHWVLVTGVTHVVPLQQPVQPDDVSHTHAPPWHRWPTAQSAPLVPQLQAPLRQRSARCASQVPHAAPFMPPQVVVIWLASAMHWPPAVQQPPGQEAAVHTHWPLWHTWPVPHAADAPQRHCPPTHESALLPHGTHAEPLAPHCEVPGLVMQVVPLQQPAQLDESHTQLTPLHRWPAAHAGPAPQPQVPVAEQVLVLCV